MPIHLQSIDCTESRIVWSVPQLAKILSPIQLQLMKEVNRWPIAALHSMIMVTDPRKQSLWQCTVSKQQLIMHVLNFLFMLPSHVVHIKIQEKVQLVCQTYFLLDVENKPRKVMYSCTICTLLLHQLSHYSNYCAFDWLKFDLVWHTDLLFGARNSLRSVRTP